MRRSLQIVFVPGLSEALLDGGALPRLAAASRTGRRSRLRCSFPCLPTVVEQTVLTGVQPGRHGVLGSAPLAHAPGPASPPGLAQRLQIADREDRARWERSLRCFRHLELAATLVESGPGSDASLEAAAAIDASLEEVIGSVRPDAAVLVCGGPGFLASTRWVDLAAVLAPEASVHLQVESAVARIQAPSSRRPSIRDRLLAEPGIERVLFGRGLELWGAAHPQAGDLLVLSERGWSFVEAAAACGHPDVDPSLHPVVLALGGNVHRPWPGDVHDYRLAPTAARFLALPEDGFVDSALAL